MSANIYYRQVKPKKRESLHIMAPSSWLERMRDEFGEQPFQLSKKDVPFLRGMKAAGIEAMEDVIDAIEQYDCIEIYAVY